MSASTTSHVVTATLPTNASSSSSKKRKILDASAVPTRRSIAVVVLYDSSDDSMSTYVIAVSDLPAASDCTVSAISEDDDEGTDDDASRCAFLGRLIASNDGVLVVDHSDDEPKRCALQFRSNGLYIRIPAAYAASSFYQAGPDGVIVHTFAAFALH